MTLSGRPIPEVPSDATALAGMLQQRYERNNADLEAFFATVTEDEAAFRPAMGEWNIKDILAHLIHSERGYQQFISDLVGGEEAWYDDFTGNLNIRNLATIAALPTTRALVDELKTARAETVALFAALPESFLARKGSFWRAGFSVADTSGDHQDTHLEQMQAALEKARS
jgi:hypothetical protein